MILITAATLLLIVLILVDVFETILLPRRIIHQFRFARFFFVHSWGPCSAVASRMKPGKKRYAFLSVFGPLSILSLIATWAVGLILSFAVLQWSLGTPLRMPEGVARFSDYLYLSGVTFLTLGYGDITPMGPLGRFVAVAETGIGFGFLAVVISYLPVLYQAFSHREVAVSLLDARAGSPPTAAQLLIRSARHRNFAALDRFLEEWERWSAEVLEIHISFPVLSFYRSQHDNQSWLAALTAILDASAILNVGATGPDPLQAQLTFAAARHTVVDLAQNFRITPSSPDPDRLPPERLAQLRAELKAAGLEIREGDAAVHRLNELRGMYEPFLVGLSQFLLLPLPPILPDSPPVDNWQTSAFMRRTLGIAALSPQEPSDDHDDH